MPQTAARTDSAWVHHDCDQVMIALRNAGLTWQLGFSAVARSQGAKHGTLIVAQSVPALEEALAAITAAELPEVDEGQFVPVRPNRTTIEIPPELQEWIDAEAKRRVCPKTRVIINALVEARDRNPTTPAGQPAEGERR